MTDFDKTRAMFHMPDGVTYLDGNSLGPLPLDARSRVQASVDDEWSQMLIRGWNQAGWMAMPAKLGDRVGKLIGAAPGTIVIGDTLSIKVFQALAAALADRPDRRVILSDTGNFPTDLYMAEGLIQTLGRGHELKTVAPEDVANHIDESVAAVMLTEVDYRTGRRHDMKALTDVAQSAGAFSIWDLAHSAGAFPVDVTGCNVDIAIGCTYKFLNGGPGAPAFIYVRPDHCETIQPALSGWLGHEAPFAFDPGYRPGPGIERMRVGTPPVLQMAALDAALDVFDMADLADIKARSDTLADRFIAEVERRCPQLTLASPRDGNARGSQVSFRFAEGYAAMQALIARGVIGDFRAPDIMRFGITPLYLGEADILRAADVLEDVMQGKLWDRPEYKVRAAVT